MLSPQGQLSYAKIGIGLLIFYLVQAFVRRWISGGPLNKIPGPQIAKLTNLRLKLAVLGGDRVHYVHKLHQQYGPIVRISPNEVAIADMEATRAIHKINSGFNKSQWYQILNKSDHPGIFAMTNVRDHATRRRLLAQSFSKSNLLKWEGLVREKTDLTIAQISKEVAEQGSADILKWFTFMATDLIGQLSFGDSFRMLEIGKKNEYVEDLESVMILSGVSAELGNVLPLLSLLPIPAIQRIRNVHVKVREYGTESIRRYRNQTASGKSQDYPTFFSKLFAAGESQTLSDAQIEQEASNLIVAGSDTTAVTMTYLVWAVLRNPQVHSRLCHELQGLPSPYTSDDVAQLKYLDAIIQESLRLYGAAPGGLPRVVPAGGRELTGYFIPGNTTVTTQAFTLHRNPEIFVEPERFKPERWLNATPQMEEAFTPFGAGSRICIGLHLARLEIVLATAAFFLAFPNAAVSEKTSDQDMAMENHFLIAPRSHACFVRV